MKNYSSYFLFCILSLFCSGFSPSYVHAENVVTTVSGSVMSGFDASGGVAIPFSVSDLAKLGGSDDSRMQSNTGWPGSGAYDENSYLEGVFSFTIPSDAVITSAVVSHEFRRSGALAATKIEVWDGAHFIDRSGTAGTINVDHVDSFDITSLTLSPATANNLKIRFLAYRDTPGTTQTSHDQITVTFVYTVPDSSPVPQPVPPPHNSAPAVLDQTVTGTVDAAIPIVFSASDTENDPLGFFLVTQPTKGTLGSISGDQIIYTPNGQLGTDTFTWKANDGANDSTLATVTIRLLPGALTQIELASDHSVVSLSASIALTVNGKDKFGNLVTSDNATMVHFSVDAPGIVRDASQRFSSGTAATLLSVPPSGIGNRMVSVTISIDTLPSVTRLFAFTAGTRPVLLGSSPGGIIPAPVDTPIEITLLGGDPRDLPLTYSIVAPPTYGTLGPLVGNKITYTPSGIVTNDAFYFHASNGSETSLNGGVYFNLKPGAPTHLVVLTDPWQPRVGTPFTIHTRLLDVFNNIVTSDNSTRVTLSATPSSAIAITETALTLTRGVAATSAIGKFVGTITYTASSGTYIPAELIDGFSPSLESLIVIEPPTASVPEGTYNTPETVELLASSGLQIMYSLDDTSPTCLSGTLYESPIAIQVTQTLKALACDSSGHSSDSVSFAYVINPQVLPGMPPEVSGGGDTSGGGGTTETSGGGGGGTNPPPGTSSGDSDDTPRHGVVIIPPSPSLVPPSFSSEIASTPLVTREYAENEGSSPSVPAVSFFDSNSVPKTTTPFVDTPLQAASVIGVAGNGKYKFTLPSIFLIAFAILYFVARRYGKKEEK